MCVCVCDCMSGRSSPVGRQDDSRRVAIEVSTLQLPLLPLDPLPRLPPGAELGRRNDDFNQISIHIPGRMQLSPGLWLIEAFCSVFIFGEQRPVIVHNTCFSPPPPPPPHSFLQPPAEERVPLFCIYLFLPLSLLKVREWRRPISARLPFCEFNSEAPGLREDAVAAPSASRVWRPRRGSRLAGAS